MKKFIAILTTVLAAFMCSLMLVACDFDIEEVVDISDVIVDDIQWGFAPDDKPSGALPTMDETKQDLYLNADTSYFLLLGFNVTAEKNNDGLGLLHVMFKVDDIDVFSGSVESGNTGNYSELEFVDGEKGTSGKFARLSFREPNKTNQVLSIKIAIRLTPIMIGEAKISAVFSSKENPTWEDMTSSEKGLFGISGNGRDGFVRNITIKRVALEAPVLAYDSSTTYLTWPHVKNAQYYRIYADDVPLKDDSGKEVIYKVDEKTQIGTTVTFTQIKESAAGATARKIKIQACNDNDFFLSSQYSNEIVFGLA